MQTLVARWVEVLLRRCHIASQKTCSAFVGLSSVGGSPREAARPLASEE